MDSNYIYLWVCACTPSWNDWNSVCEKHQISAFSYLKSNHTCRVYNSLIAVVSGPTHSISVFSCLDMQFSWLPRTTLSYRVCYVHMYVHVCTTWLLCYSYNSIMEEPCILLQYLSYVTCITGMYTCACTYSKYGVSCNISGNRDNHSSFIPFKTMSSSFCILYSIICPDEESLFPITLWTIMSKVRIEACMWVSPS